MGGLFESQADPRDREQGDQTPESFCLWCLVHAMLCFFSQSSCRSCCCARAQSFLKAGQRSSHVAAESVYQLL